MSISYVLTNCNKDFKSYNGFVWPAKGPVESNNDDKWLMGFLDGCGNGNLVSWESDAQWLLVAVPTESLLDFGDCVRFRQGEVLFSSQDRLAVIEELERLNPDARHKPIIGANRTNLTLESRVSVGYRGTAIAGQDGMSIAGFEGTSVTGRFGTSFVGARGICSAGLEGNLVFYFNKKIKTFHVDGNEVRANTSYKLDNDGNLILVK